MTDSAISEPTLIAGRPSRPGLSSRRGTGRLSSWQLFSFGLPNFTTQAAIVPIGMLLAPFFTGDLGVTLTTWALIAGLARIVDIATDPLVGVICDRLPSRWGRRRHWVVISTPFVMIGCAMLFTPEYFTRTPTFWYVMIATLLFNFATTVQGLNHAAWGGELSTNYAERTRIMGWRSGIGAIARFLAFGIPATMEWVVPSASTGDKLEVLMWALIILMPITTLIAVTTVPERPMDATTDHRQRFSLREIGTTIKHMFTNKYLGWILLVDVLQAGPTSIKAALFVFYVSYIMGAPGLVSTLLLAVFASSVITTPLWMKIAKGREKHRLLAVSVFLYGCSQATMLFWGPNELFFFACAIVVNGAMNAGPAFLMQSIMADVVDYGTAKNGTQQTGTYFAVLETTAKLAPALALMLIFPMLQGVGFDPTGKANTPEALDAIRITFALAPTIPVLLASFLLWNFPLGSVQQAELRALIEARKLERSMSSTDPG
jgi:GPH family glycoside/pentoside/hexuronide:cation symporter